MATYNTKEIMTFLNNIVTNKGKVGENEQVELSFLDPASNKKITVEEMAELIPQMDINELSKDEMDLLETLHRRLANDDSNGNMFSNEDGLVGPLEQKINEYNHVVDNAEFNSNVQALKNLKAKNQNLSMVNMIDLKDYETDSKNNLDYITVRRANGQVEMLPITDPDYVDRFVSEYANDISGMDGEQFYNTLRNSTETQIDFVDMNMFIANPEVRNKMNAPRVHDEQILGFEQDEVKRLVEQFIPGTRIEIGIDKSGEIFYRAGDALFKGFDKDGQREVRFVQEPSQINNYVDNKATGDIKDQIKAEEGKTIEVASQSKGGFKAKENMFFDVQRLANLMDARDAILNGNDMDLKSEFFGLISGGLKDRSQDTVMKHGQRLITNYYNSRKNDYELMKNTGNTSNGIPMSAEEVHIMEEIEKIDRSINMDQARSDAAREEIEKATSDDADSNMDSDKEEEDIFGFDEFDKDTYVDRDSNDMKNDKNDEDYFEFDDPDIDEVEEVQDTMQSGSMDMEEETLTQTEVPRITSNRVRTLSRNNKKNYHHGLSALTVIIEIATVALIIMMFLSLDI